MTPERLRYRAARFFYKDMPAWLDDWVRTGATYEDDNMPVGFDDVSDLYVLLVDTVQESRTTSATPRDSAKGEQSK